MHQNLLAKGGSKMHKYHFHCGEKCGLSKSNMVYYTVYMKWLWCIQSMFKTVSLGMLSDFFCCYLQTFFNIAFFQNTHSVIPLECQTAWIQIRQDISSHLIKVQNVCKCYQQTTKFAVGRLRAILHFGKVTLPDKSYNHVI